MPEWNSMQYLKYGRERTQPAIDLAARISASDPARIIDIGCGPGNSTAVLKKTFPNAYILGVDNSQNMLDTARKEYPGLDFALFDASKDFSLFAEKFDLVFSNACIQWIPNHPVLLKNMMGLLSEKGVLAVQTPVNYDEPIHRIIGETVKSSKWAAKFPHPRIFYNLSPGEYYDLLSQISSDFTMWETTYFHRMKSHADIMEWYKGTGLRPYLEVLSDQDKAEFENDVFGEVVKRYPVQANGEVIFRFPRLFFIAVK